MDMPPVRHLLAKLVEAHHSELQARVSDFVSHTPDLAFAHQAESPTEYDQTLATALNLLCSNLAHPNY